MPEQEVFALILTLLLYVLHDLLSVLYGFLLDLNDFALIIKLDSDVHYDFLLVNQLHLSVPYDFISIN